MSGWGTGPQLFIMCIAGSHSAIVYKACPKHEKLLKFADVNKLQKSLKDDTR